MTLREIAKKARVSVGTASNVLTGAVPVRPERRERVLAVVRSLRYHPNFVARSLKLRRTSSLGLVIGDITNPFFAQVARGVEDAALKRGFAPMIFNTDDKIGREERAFAFLRSQRVDGILLVVAPGPDGRSHIMDALKLGIPIVCLDRVPRGLKVDSVTVDNASAAQQCVQHLIELGHRRIGIITGSLDLETGRRRLDGYKSALRQADIKIAPELIGKGDFHTESGYQLAGDMLSGRHRPTALFVCNNLMTIGVMKALLAVGLRCPEDVAVATFDDMPVTELYNPPLTAIAQPAYSMGHIGAELLMERIQLKKTDRTPKVVRLSTELKIRESTIGKGPKELTAEKPPSGS